MTNEERQQAIEWLKSRPITMPGAKKMYALAIEALEAYVPDMNVGETESSRENDPKIAGCSDDTISRKAAIDAIHEDADWLAAQGSDWQVERMERDKSILKSLPSAQPETNSSEIPNGWIPFKTRPLTEEEKEEYPEWDSMLDCELPDDGQRILVNIKYKTHEAVQMDEFYTDDGCYLDSGYEIGTEATAWMPLPEPWKGE